MAALERTLILAGKTTKPQATPAQRRCCRNTAIHFKFPDKHLVRCAAKRSGLPEFFS